MSYAILKVPFDHMEDCELIAKNLAGTDLGVERLIVIPLNSELLMGKLAENELTTLHKTIHELLALEGEE